MCSGGAFGNLCLDLSEGAYFPISLRKPHSRTKKGAVADGPFSVLNCAGLLDDLDHPVRAGIDQNRPVVHDRIAVLPRAIFRRHVVIGYALLGQDGADPDVLAIAVGWAVLLDHIAVEARA